MVQVTIDLNETFKDITDCLKAMEDTVTTNTQDALERREWKRVNEWSAAGVRLAELGFSILTLRDHHRL